MEVYGSDLNGAPEMVFDKVDSVAIVSNLIEGEVSYQMTRQSLNKKHLSKSRITNKSLQF